MSIEILNEIKSTEEQADQIEAQAQLKARDTIASARKDAAAILEKAIVQAELDSKNVVKAAEEKAARDILEMKSKINDQCNTIKQNSVGKLDKAVDHIVRRVVELK